ncbi:right-handed parallel beta-helix repeat-containing protein [Pseudoruegeria sp. SK021]|uniref:right-handed parallel beta-helix repeat-containing protein n=1 Tax=Pseudoruegeria sp. SK021 TaxID=1933035 RepID=UPI000A2407BD|nr:right-handed parallel beta-helix repeat-containing protein [Pseudoruegeria sp. SK021]OSP54073.1 hypothetical protein BV911_14380 [Pseudoruegeria sp. SK021]
MSDILVKSSSELVQALRQATGGDTIFLAPGDYETLFIKDLAYASDVTLTSLDAENPAVFTAPVTFVRANGLVLDNIIFQSDSIEGTSGSAPLLFLHSSENVTMTDLVFTGYLPSEEEGVDAYAATTTRGDAITGYGYQTGLRIHNSDNVSLEDATFRDLRYAIYTGESTEVDLTGMSIEQVREGIMFYEVQGMVISDSVFQNFKPWLGMDDPAYDTNTHDHPDMIQYWGDNSTLGVHDITITGNTFIAEPGGSTQTIFGHLGTGPAGVTASNFTVTDNTIINGHPHAISLGDVDGAVISGNVLLPNSDGLLKYWAPSIGAPGGQNLEIYDNVVVYWNGYGVWALDEQERAAANVSIGDNTLLSDDPDDENYWGFWSPASDYPLVQWAEEAGLGTVLGTETGEVLWASSHGSFIEGLGGDDTLSGRAGTDILTGGGGADRFLYDMRGATVQGDDLILDLDFSEGDSLYILTGTMGLFSDSAISGNDLRVLGDGSSAIVDSFADIGELVASGAMIYDSDGLGGGVLSLTSGDGHALYIAGLDAASLPEDTIDPTPADPEPDILGTAAGETLWASSRGSFIDAREGDDTLFGRTGADILMGGDGADRFVFDLRSSSAAEDDLILDLDFSEGDEIYILTNTAGQFTDSHDPGNDLRILSDGASVMITSLADLQEVVASGAMTYDSDGDSGGFLRLADGTGYGLQIEDLYPLL